MEKKNKYLYLRVLQQLVEGKWEDEGFYEENELKDLRTNIKAYRNEGYIVRVLRRRVLNNGEPIHI